MLEVAINVSKTINFHYTLRLQILRRMLRKYLVNGNVLIECFIKKMCICSVLRT